ncbi:MAG: methyl-accepting chemotaxis protein [Xanthomonadales bacterium]|jgi:twitching motility protein PilJ|nr:methyl-accepting chemotaxis protein [Xanthomonadales bacterium]
MSTAAGSARRESGNGTSILVVVLILSLVVVFVNFYLTNIRNNEDRAAIAAATDIQVKSQQLAKYSAEAADGSLEAFDNLQRTWSAIGRQIGDLRNGNNAGVPPINNNKDVEPALAAVENSWRPTSDNVQKILGTRETVVELAEIAADFNVKVLPMQTRSDELTRILSERGAGAGQVYIAGRQVAIAERLLRRLTEIREAGENAPTAADSFGRDARIFGSTLSGLMNGDAERGIARVAFPDAQELLQQIGGTFGEIEQSVDQILQGSTELFEAKQAANEVFADAERLLREAELLAIRYGEESGRRGFPSIFVAAIAGAIALLALFFLALALYRDQQRRYRITADLNQRNQEAILRLLDEMGSLAEGDLTVRATVSEDITGAIADSINFAVEALRSLVTTINETAVQVAAAAQETQATAMHLAEAAEHQAQQITSASAAINEIAVSIDEVSKNSAESADVAQRSVQIASKGAAIVRQTIQGMDNIRDQIQETSKRIKRLGESSQEIGSIVELINDIAEQTNILALNAAIQAASAGEAGRGFAVVADEVQRLAERASNATKRIETLVQTIQSDTNEAVTSMEQTTSEVVAGARLAEDAGLALGEIERVSNDLADLIQNISEAARQQSAAATNISATMNVIQEITTQTSVGASQTAESIGNLAQLAADLRRSVADFKLPA